MDAKQPQAIEQAIYELQWAARELGFQVGCGIDATGKQRHVAEVAAARQALLDLYRELEEDRDEWRAIARKQYAFIAAGGGESQNETPTGARKAATVPPSAPQPRRVERWAVARAPGELKDFPGYGGSPGVYHSKSLAETYLKNFGDYLVHLVELREGERIVTDSEPKLESRVDLHVRSPETGKAHEKEGLAATVPPSASEWTAEDRAEVDRIALEGATPLGVRRSYDVPSAYRGTVLGQDWVSRVTSADAPEAPSAISPLSSLPPNGEAERLAEALEADAKMNEEIPVKSHLWETAKLERAAARLLREREKKQVVGFYEYEFPEYSDEWTNELQSPVTAAELNALVDKLRERGAGVEKAETVEGVVMETAPYSGGGFHVVPVSVSWPIGTSVTVSRRVTASEDKR